MPLNQKYKSNLLDFEKKRNVKKQRLSEINECLLEKKESKKTHIQLRHVSWVFKLEKNATKLEAN